MPRATTNKTDTERFDLESLPSDGDEEGGFVELRRMSYGEVLHRRQMGTTMSLQQGEGGGTQGTMEMIQRRMTEYEFAKCIIDHNLTDENDKKLNFKNGTTFDKLDPRVGEEIGRLIDDMNQLEATEREEGNSLIELGEAS